MEESESVRSAIEQFPVLVRTGRHHPALQLYLWTARLGRNTSIEGWRNRSTPALQINNQCKQIHPLQLGVSDCCGCMLTHTVCVHVLGCSESRQAGRAAGLHSQPGPASRHLPSLGPHSSHRALPVPLARHRIS